KAGLLLSQVLGNPEEPVGYLTYDSRDLGENTLFVCKGAAFKEEYLQQVVDRGITAYVSEKVYPNIDPAVPHLTVSDIRKAMPVLAGLFYENAWKELNLVGITGTKGKSTTTYYVKSILDTWMAEENKPQTGVISSIDTYDGVIFEESHLTTPEVMDLYKHFRNAVNSGIEYMEMEVSSQGLKYDRVEGISFEAGAFLNIGRDHISDIEHPDFDDYLNSKLKIFAHCKKAAINLDCDQQERIKAASEDCPYVITFSQHDEAANVYGYDVVSNEGNVSMRVRLKDVEGYEDFDEPIELGIFGTINVEDALAAVALSALLGVPFRHIKAGLKKAVVPGRMEVFRSADGKRIAIVDYAHNKISYERFFETIKEEFPDKKVLIVFGSAGGKAFQRREELGTIAGQNCEYSIITEEDYGEEDVYKICNEIGSYVAAAGGKYEVIVDRPEAVKKAIEMTDENTILFIPGKGRETRLKRGVQYVDAPSDVELVQKYL
ncbi:MAG: UDP-N-acetylmuramyl-tripeptide synthetase, partial [Firmicutes bacterium]|nr:UDP-N-acetylmuramyl-tripeptide synthetase [Bacillota bacterium]